MVYEESPIHLFVANRFHTPQVQKIVENWRVEPEVVIEKVIEHFRELGIFKVSFNHQRIVTEVMITHLKTSPEIMRLVVKSRNDELKRQRNRHAD